MVKSLNRMFHPTALARMIDSLPFSLPQGASFHEDQRRAGASSCVVVLSSLANTPGAEGATVGFMSDLRFNGRPSLGQVPGSEFRVPGSLSRFRVPSSGFGVFGVGHLAQPMNRSAALRCGS